jgi:hypothetical protein
MSAEFPRWTNRERLHPLERQVHDLACEVEQAGAHPLLTDVSTALFESVRKLVDWFDAGQPGADWEGGNRPLTQDDERLVREAWEARLAHNIGGDAETPNPVGGEQS